MGSREPRVQRALPPQPRQGSALSALSTWWKAVNNKYGIGRTGRGALSLVGALLLALTVVVMVQSPQQANAVTLSGQPGQAVTVRAGDGSSVVISTVLKSAGYGQAGVDAAGAPQPKCVITSSLGYDSAYADDSTNDNNTCAGGPATYSINFTYELTDQPVSFVLDPVWLDRAALPGMPDPNVDPTLNIPNLGRLGPATLEWTTIDGKRMLKITFPPNQKGTAGIEANVSTVAPWNRWNDTQYNPAGAFTAGINVYNGDTGEKIGTAQAKEPLNVLATARWDQRIYNSYQDANVTWIDGKPYMGVGAESLLTTGNSSNAIAVPAGYSSTLGLFRLPARDELSRYTLVMDGNTNFQASDVYVRYGTGELTKAKLDSNGNPYVEGFYTQPDNANGYTTPFKIFVPVENYAVGQKVNLTTRMDPVNSDGEFTKVEYGTTFNPSVYTDLPGVTDQPAFGSNTVDPGTNSACTVSTLNAEQGLVRGTQGYPNNNCALQPIVRPADDGSSTQKFDAGGWTRATVVGDTSSVPVTASNVRVTLGQADTTQGSETCAVWKPGTQTLTNRPSHVRVNSTSGPWFTWVFPEGKVYATTGDAIDSSGNIDCDSVEWTLIDGKDESGNMVSTDFANFPGGIAAISGFKFVIPGDAPVQVGTQLWWMVQNAVPTALADPAYLAEYPMVTATNGKEYYQTWNYVAVKPQNGSWTVRNKQLILQETPKSGIYDLWNPTEKIANTIGQQDVEIQTSVLPQLVNGVPAIIDSKQPDGTPTFVTERFYPDKCLDVNTNNFTDNMTYHRGNFSDDINNCGYDPTHYVDVIYVQSEQPYVMPDGRVIPPAYPAGFEAANASKPNVFLPITQRITYVTPPWAAPEMSFYVRQAAWTTKNLVMTNPGTGPADEPTWEKDTATTNDYGTLASKYRDFKITIPVASIAQPNKDVIDDYVPVDTKFRHALSLQNFTTMQGGPTTYIDVLPYNGDGRGTNYHGEYYVYQVPKLVTDRSKDTGTMQIFYTTDDPATVSACPESPNSDGYDATSADAIVCAASAKSNPTREAINSMPSNTNWQLLPSDPVEAQKIIDAQNGALDPAGTQPKITAFKFAFDNFAPETNRVIYLDFQPKDNEMEDVYVNSLGTTVIQGYAPAPAPNPVETMVYSSMLSGYVYWDPDLSGTKTNSDAPVAGRTVVLYNPDGTERARTTTTDTGYYEFREVPAGYYKVEVLPTDPVNDQELNLEAGKLASDQTSYNATNILIKGLTPGQNGGRVENNANNNFGLYIADPRVTVQKVANEPERKHEVGETVTYTITGVNVGNVPVTGVILRDTWLEGKKDLAITCQILDADGAEKPNAGNILEAPGVALAINEGYTCTATYEVTQADVDAGQGLVNTATVDASYKSRIVTSPQSSATALVVEQSPSIDIDNVVNNVEVDTQGLGGTASYTFTVTNNGNVTLTNPVVTTEGLPEGATVECPDKPESLAPGASYTCTVTFTVTQEQVDAQTDIVVNATVTATDPKGTEVTDTDPSTLKVVQAEPNLAVAKTVRAAGTEDEFSERVERTAGETAEFQIVVSNTGNVTLNNVDLADAIPTKDPISLTCKNDDDSAFATDGTGSIPVGKSITCTGTYLVTQADVDAGSDLVNTATVNATALVKDGEGNPAETPISGNDTATVAVPPANPALTVSKKIDNRNFALRNLGQTAEFTIEVVNSGNVTLNDVELADTFTRGADTELTLSPQACTVDGNSVTLPTVNLAPGKKMVCVSSYVVTQEDLDAQQELNNTVTATGSSTRVDGSKVTTPEVPPASVTVLVPPVSGALTVEKVVDNQDLVTKRAGESAEFTIKVTNNTNVTANELVITDTWVAGKDALTLTCSDGADFGATRSLAPQASVTCTGSYTLTQEDIDNGSNLDNTVEVTGKAGNTDVPLTGTDKATIAPEPRQPGLTVNKQVDGQKIRNITAPGTVEYVITGSNTGNTTLTNVTLEDNLNKGDVTAPRDITCEAGGQTFSNTQPLAALAPGETFTCRYTMDVTQEDLNAGSALSNTVNVEASTPGTDVPLVENSTATLIPIQQPSMTLTKVVDGQASVQKAPGETGTFTITAANTGNVDYATYTLTEDFASDLGKANLNLDTCQIDGQAWTNGSALPVGKSVVCEATYEVTAADMDAQKPIVNNVSAAGTYTDPNGETKTSNANATATITVPPAQPSMFVDKVVNGGNTAIVKAGETATFTITGGNNGNVTLTDVVVADTWQASEPLALACAVVDATGATVTDRGDLLAGARLLPGDRFTCTAQYQMTQADIDAQANKLNTVTLDASTVNGPIPKQTSDATVIPAVANPNVALAKVVDGEEIVTKGAGETATFTITATNTGNVTISDVNLTEDFPAYPNLKLNECKVGDREFVLGSDDLAPGETLNCVAEYTVTVANAVAGDDLVNTVNLSGTAPKPLEPGATQNVSRTDTATIKVVAAEPKLEVTKVVDNQGPAVAGDVLTYTIVAKNTGNTELRDVELAESMKLDGFTCTETLADGSTAEYDKVLGVGDTVTCTGTHTVTGDEVAAGGPVENTVTPSATYGDGTPLNSDPVKATTTLVDTTSISGTVFADPNRDGNFAGESGIDNTKQVVVELLDADGNVVDSRVTSDGTYSFDNIPAGEYQVRFTLPDNTLTFSPKTGDDSEISAAELADATAGTNPLVAETAPITAKAGEPVANVDAGVYPSDAAVTGGLFLDEDGDGDIDGATQVTEPVTVELLDKEGNVVATTTMVGGSYSFESVQAGEYQVRFTLPENSDLEFTKKGSKPIGDAGSVDAKPADDGRTATTEFFTLTDGQTLPTVDAGVKERAIPVVPDGAAKVFVNEPTDTTDGSGDGQTPGQAVVIKTDSTPVTFTFVNDSDEALTNLDMAYAIPAGDTATLSDTVTVTITDAEGNVVRTFDAQVTDGKIDLAGVTLQPGETISATGTLSSIGETSSGELTVNATGATSSLPVSATDPLYLRRGEEPNPGTISGTIFSDEGNDGDLTGENPLEGTPITVTLLDASGSPVLDESGDPITVTTTDGTFTFDGVPPGDYRVRFNLPDGSELSFGPKGEGELGEPGSSDATPSTDGKSATTGVFTVNPGGTVSTVDAGVKTLDPLPPAPPGSISGTIFNDESNDGIVIGEKPAKDTEITVELLDKDGNPVLDESGDPITVTTTDGTFTFDGVPPGDYQVRFSLPDGSELSFGPKGEGELGEPGYSDATPLEGGKSATTGVFTLTEGGAVSTVDAGIRTVPAPEPPQTGGISGTIFLDPARTGDLNGASVATGVAITVTLYNEDGTPVLRDGKPVTVTTTDGTYSFTGLPAGNYRVGFSWPEEYRIGGTTAGEGTVGDPGRNDARLVPGSSFAAMTGVITVGDNQRVANVDTAITPAVAATAKIFVVTPTDEVDGRGDGQTPGQAVRVPRNEVPVTFTVTAGTDPVRPREIRYSVPNGTLSEYLEVKVTGPGNLYEDGAAFRLQRNPDGSFTLPDGLVLLPGQTLTGTGTLTFEGKETGGDLLVTWTDEDGTPQTDLTDPLYLELAQEIPVVSGSSVSPWWLVPLVGLGLAGAAGSSDAGSAATEVATEQPTPVETPAPVEPSGKGISKTPAQPAATVGRLVNTGANVLGLAGVGAALILVGFLAIRRKK